MGRIIKRNLVKKAGLIGKEAPETRQTASWQKLRRDLMSGGPRIDALPLKSIPWGETQPIQPVHR